MADKHSEVEAKYDGTNLNVPQVTTYVAQLCNGSKGLHGSGFAFDKYKQVDGDDRYWFRDENVLRHRFDGKRRTSVLTVKQRKTAESTSDRKEIDLPLREDVPPGDVEAFLTMTGWTPLFMITKQSYIYHISVRDAATGKTHVACLALYDVCDLSQPEHDMGWDRYLEIEIEKESNCSHEEALEYLSRWEQMLQSDLGLGEPMNKSLLEIYRPKPAGIKGLCMPPDELVTGASQEDIKKTIQDFNGRCML